MKNHLSLLVIASFTMVLAGCSTHSPTASTSPAIDLVQTGKDIQFADGSVVRVAKREGNSLEGIHILMSPSGGPAREITAEMGTIKPGTPEHSNFENQITLTLHNAKAVSGQTNFTAATMVIVLYKPN